MVSNCPTIKEALPHILEFFKGAALVSHNIEFDYNMLNEAMANNGFGSLTAPGLDTLAFSRYFFPDSARHRLGSLCKRLDIDYDEESAHRADYDAEVLSKCFLSIRSMFLKENKELTLNDLEHLTITTEMLKKRSFKNFHYTVYAKNRQGLKDLYRIVSESHINYMGYVPSTPKSLLEKYRENLIIGSACFNGEVFYACGHRNLKSLQKAIEFCDFVEIQPLECYSFLVNYHIDGMYSIEDVKRNLLTIINEAKKLNKIIFDEIHSIDTSINSLILLNKLIDNINSLLNNGIEIRKLADLGGYLRKYGDRIDFVKIETWIKLLKIKKICTLIGCMLVSLFSFEIEELPFMRATNNKILRKTDGMLNIFLTSIPQPAALNENNENHGQGINPITKPNTNPLKFFNYFPVETASRFISNIAKSLSNIDE